MGFPLCWALCAPAWSKAEPCAGVRGRVSVEVISLNFLLKCQPACLLVESQYSDRDSCVACAAVQVEPRDPARMGIRARQATHFLALRGAPCSEEQQSGCERARGRGCHLGFWGTGCCESLDQRLFNRGERAHRGGCTGLLVSFDLNRVCVRFSTERSFPQVWIFTPVLWAGSCCRLRTPLLDRRSAEPRERRSAGVCLARGDHCCVYAGEQDGFGSAARFFFCRNGLILLLDISISLYLDIGFPCRGICGF